MVNASYATALNTVAGCLPSC